MMTYRLSKKSNLGDLAKPVRDYLKRTGQYTGSIIATKEVWVRREGRYVVAVGATRESVTPPPVAT